MPESPSERTITREELYERVWNNPMTKVAEEFGVSNTAMAKVCRRLNVPRPSRGHWMKIRSGKKSKQVALPPPDESTPAPATIRPENGYRLKMTTFEDAATTKAVEIPSDLRRCHPLVTKTKKVLEAGKPYQAIVRTREAGALNVDVSKAGIHRALVLMEAFIRGCEARGWTVQSSDTAARTEVVIGDDPVSVLLFEKIDRIELEPSKIGGWRQFEYHPSGRLGFQIHGAYGVKLRGKWMDGKTQRLETLLSEIIAALELHSEGLKKSRIEWEERRKRWAEEERLRKERAERIKAEKARRSELSAFAASWKKASHIREFCAALEAKTQSDPERYSAQNVQRWIEWAHAVVDKIDPFQGDSLLAALSHTDLDASLTFDESDAS